MEKLNELFAKRFLAVPMLHFAFQITSNALAELLLERDPGDLPRDHTFAVGCRRHTDAVSDLFSDAANP